MSMLMSQTGEAVRFFSIPLPSKLITMIVLTSHYERITIAVHIGASKDFGTLSRRRDSRVSVLAN